MTETPINFNRAKISCRAPKFSTEVETFIISKMRVLKCGNGFIYLPTIFYFTVI